MVQKYVFPQQTEIDNAYTDSNSPANAVATKAYVDSQPGGTFYIYENGPRPFSFNGTAITIQTGFTGQINTFNLIIPTADESDFVTYLLANTGPYYFASNSTTPWTVQTATVSGGGFVSIETTAAENYPNPVPTGNPVLSIQLGLDALEGIAAGTNVTLPTSIIDGKKVATINSTATGGGSLQSLSDVTVVEPSFARVGTFTVDTVDINFNQIIITQINTGIVVGDYLNGTGTAGSATLKVIFVTTVGQNTNVQFASSPAPYFSVGSSIFRLGTGIDNYNLTWSNTTNRWIALPTNFNIPFDLVNWTTVNQRLYVTSSTVGIALAQITSNVSTLSNPWTFGAASIPGFTSGSEVIGVDASGRSVSGQYLDATASGGSSATLNNVLADRLAGGSFALNTTYNLFWRQGVDALASTVQFTGSTITQGQSAVIATADAEIAAKIGSAPAFNTGTQASASTTAILIPGTNQIDVTRPGALLAWQQITGSTASTLPTAALAPLPQYSYLAYSTTGAQGSFSAASQFATVQVPLAGAALYFNYSGARPAWATNAVLSNQIYYGDATTGQTPVFTFQPPPLAAIDKEIAANAVTSLDTIKGDISLVAGTGIGISNSIANKTITLTNTSSGISSGNTIDFTNDQFSEIGITELATESIYIQMGLTSATEIGSGGTLNGTVYWDTSNAAPSGAGLGLRARVATTWASLGIVVYTPAYSIVFTTPAGASANNYILDNLLFAKKTYSGNIYANANLWPPYRDAQASDDVQMIAVVSPTFSVVSSGTNQWTASVGQGVWRGSFGNYTWASGDINTEYVAYLRIAENSGATHPPTFVSATRTSGLGGIQLLTSLPGQGGSTSTLQQILNVSNSANTTSPNVASLILTNSTTNKNTVLSATNGLESQQIILDGSTSGNLTLKAAATTSSYSVALPSSAPSNGQSLIGDGSGSSAWAWPTNLITAVSLLNVTPLSGTGVLVDSVSVQSGNEILLAGQNLASQNGIYIVSAGPWSKVTDYENQTVLALSGNANIGQAYSKTNAVGNEQWVLTNPSTVNLIPSGYGVFSASTNTITCQKYAGSASASDFFVGMSIWGAGLTSTVAYGGIIVSAIGIPSGNSIVLTLNNSSSTWSAGRPLYFLPRISTFDFPIVSTGTNLIGLSLGTGLSLDSVGRLQVTGSGGGGVNYNVYTTTATSLTVLTAFTNSSTFTIAGTSTTGLIVGSLISFSSNNAFSYSIQSLTVGAVNTVCVVTTIITDAVAAGNVIYKLTASSTNAVTSLSAANNIFLQQTGTNLQIGASQNPIFATGQVLTPPTLGVDIARLADLQISAAGFFPQPPAKVVATTSFGATYTNNSGVSTAVLSGTNTAGATLIIDGVTLVVGDRILFVAQDAITGAAANVSNGAYTLTTNLSGGSWTATRTATVPATGNSYYISAGSTGINNVWVNSTIGTITVGTTPIIFNKFSQVQDTTAAQNLQQVLAQGRSATTAVSNLTLFSDLTYPLNFTSSAGNTSIGAGTSNSIITLNGSNSTITIGKGSAFATIQNGDITSSSQSIVGSGNGSLTLTSETAGLAKISYPIELQCAGQKLSVGTALANYVQIIGSVAGAAPSIGALGSDGNIQLNLFSRGSSGFFISNGFGSCTITPAASSLTIAPTAAATTINLSTLGTVALGYQAAGANYISAQSFSSGSAPVIAATGADSTINLNLSSKGNSGLIAFNAYQNSYLTISGAATGNPAISVAGASAAAFNLVHGANSQVNIGSGTGAFLAVSGSATVSSIQPTALNGSLTVAPSGTGVLILGNTATQTGITVSGTSTTQSILMATGASTNLDLVLQSKGINNVLFANSNAVQCRVTMGTNSAGTLAVGIGPVVTGSTSADLMMLPQGGGWFYPIGLVIPATLALQGKIGLPTGIPNGTAAPTMGAGTAGQTIISNGTASAPFWGGSATSFTSTLASSSIAASVDTLINWPTATAPDGITYSAGVFTNSSGRTLKVLFQMQVTATYSSNPTETDSWFSYNGGIGVGTRFGQVALTNPGFTSVMMQPKWTFSLANNDTVRCYYWANIASTLGAGVFGGAQTQIAVSIAI